MNSFPELEVLKYCDNCETYLDNDNDYNRNEETLKHKVNVRLIDGEKIKGGDRFECITRKITLSQCSVETHFRTKMHLDNVTKDVTKFKDITKDNDITKDETKV